MKLRDWRERDGLTQAQVSVMTGISLSQISKYECGKWCPSPRHIVAIREASRGAVDLDDWVEKPKVERPRRRKRAA